TLAAVATTFLNSTRAETSTSYIPFAAARTALTAIRPTHRYATEQAIFLAQPTLAETPGARVVRPATAWFSRLTSMASKPYCTPLRAAQRTASTRAIG